MIPNLTPQEDGSFLVHVTTLGRVNQNGTIFAPISQDVIDEFNKEPRVGGIGQRPAGIGDWSVPREDVAYTLKAVTVELVEDSKSPLGKLQRVTAVLSPTGPRAAEIQELVSSKEEHRYFGMRAITAQEGWVDHHPVHAVKEILSWDLLADNPYPETN